MALKNPITDSGDVYKQIEGILDRGKAGIFLWNQFDDFDPRFIRDKYWKFDPMGNLTNTWCRFYTKSTEPQSLAERDSDAANNNVQLGDYVPLFDGRGSATDIVVFGVSINVSSATRTIETPIKGSSHPIYQSYSQEPLSIDINFLESGPVFWQQNNFAITKLVNILRSNEPLFISNPQLELAYGVNKVMVKNWNIGQDPRFYSHNNISIQLKSTIDYDLFERTNEVF